MSDATAPLLSCRCVSKYFGAMAAVRDLTFDMNAGDILGIGGPNGAGKTTLFELISGLNPADSGEILLDGQRIDRLPPHAICHRGVARVFQSNAGFDSMTTRQNVLVAAVYGREPRAVPPLRFDRKVRDAADTALEFVGLAARADVAVSNLSVLERKLLMFASAMATRPRLLLMDEPVGGLNPEEIDQVMGLVRKVIAEGTTVMLIEHVMRFLVQLSTRVIIMHHGEKIFEGPPRALASDETVKNVYLGESMSKRVAEYSGGVAAAADSR